MGVGTQESREAGHMVLLGWLRQAGRVLPASVTRGWEASPTAALKSQPRLAGGAEATGALSVYVWTCPVEQTPSLCLREGHARGAGSCLWDGCEVTDEVGYPKRPPRWLEEVVHSLGGLRAVFAVNKGF